MSIEIAKSTPAGLTPPEPGGAPEGKGSGSRRPAMAALTLGALGVVFGDIGTSPLYAIQTVFTADNNAVGTSPDQVYGVISLVFWAITLIVSVKYVTFILRADNGGEGGIMALTALVQKLDFKSARTKVILVALGIFGASLFYGDGMITPAISVLSAVEGLKVSAPGLSSFVIPVTIAVLVLLFAIQRYGTNLVGNLFGPVMAVWFLILGATGGAEVLSHPGIIKALSPVYGLRFIVDHGLIAFVALASVVLAVTGAEALYADMGHFGRSPIHRAWFFLVFPTLTLNYLGQGSLILRTPSAISNPFFLLMPGWAQFPMVILATIATVIASQAVISGAFSVTRQAVQLGVLPHMTIRHTSEHEVGQVYAPVINWGLFGAVVALVVGFGSSAALASAYGVAVTATFVLNTVLFLAVARVMMRKPGWMIALGAVVFLTSEIAFFAANLTKVVHGGWLPLLVAFTVFTILITWQRGRQIVTPNRTALEGSLREFCDIVDAMDPPVHRVDGTAVFLNRNIETTPLALRANVEHNHTLHKNVVILSVVVERVPTIPESERCAFDDLGHSDDGITHLTARFGFQDEPNIPQVLRLAAQHPDAGQIHGLQVDDVSYFLSRMTIIRTDAPGMQRWRKKLFLTLANNASSPVTYFGLPSDRCVIMGAQVSV
ncbi:KUP system potassium uptake protein [Kitasatospora sp. MAA4]|uniref:potassium transporter Kup n=1 Tax=Kitasatospora sp. MAA4 TaxID=3035093 RepID=UPI002473B3DD|nr:potassium transporter Kup [Kitasatospora sp. MAA4]MDH6137515.1 KUP system potassium uptake protein [Kitasatospora sp. MAA4]